MLQVQLPEGHTQLHRINLALYPQLLQSLLEIGLGVHLQARPISINLTLKCPLGFLLHLYAMQLKKLVQYAFRIVSDESVAIVNVQHFECVSSAEGGHFGWM